KQSHDVADIFGGPQTAHRRPATLVPRSDEILHLFRQAVRYAVFRPPGTDPIDGNAAVPGPLISRWVPSGSRLPAVVHPGAGGAPPLHADGVYGVRRAGRLAPFRVNAHSRFGHLPVQ